MYTKSSYTKLTEDRIDKNEKKNNWEVAIGLNEVDSLKPSKISYRINARLYRR